MFLLKIIKKVLKKARATRFINVSLLIVPFLLIQLWRNLSSFLRNRSKTLKPEILWQHSNLSHHVMGSVIKQGKVYATVVRKGLYVFDLDTGKIEKQYAAPYCMDAPPIIDIGYALIVDFATQQLVRIDLANGHVRSVGVKGLSSGHALGHDSAHHRVIIPSAEGLMAYNIADLSLAWAQPAVAYNPGKDYGVLVYQDYIYAKSWKGSSIYKVNKNNGEIVAFLNIGVNKKETYNSPIYDSDNKQVYFGVDNKVVAINDNGFSLAWVRSLEDSSYNIEVALSYHKNKIIAAIEEDSKKYRAKIYCLDAFRGDVLWVNTDPFNDGRGLGEFLITENYVITNSYLYNIVGRWLGRGKIYLIKIQDGLTDKTITTKSYSDCAKPSASKGLFINGQAHGKIQALKLGKGLADDFYPFGGGEGYVGFTGERLRIILNFYL